MEESKLDKIKKVSILLLSYNNLEYLESCFASIVSQTYQNIEVIFSDDCSKNIDVEKIKNRAIKALGNSNIEIKYIFHKSNVGTVKNINNAIANSTGDVVVPLAIDDLLFDNKTIESIVDFFNEHQCLIASSIRANFIENGEIISYMPTPKQKVLFEDSTNLLNDILKFGNFVGGCNTYYRKELFEQFGYFDESYRLLEDYPFYINLLQNGCNIPLINEPCLKYRYGGVSNGKFHPLFVNDMNLLYDRLLNSNLKKSIKAYIKYNRYFMFNGSKIKKLIYAMLHFKISISKYRHSKKYKDVK